MTLKLLNESKIKIVIVSGQGKTQYLSKNVFPDYILDSTMFFTEKENGGHKRAKK